MAAPTFGQDVICSRCGDVHPVGECPEWNKRDSAEWEAEAGAYVRGLEAGTTFTAEDVTRKLGRPWQPNTVGGLFRDLAAEGVIARAGPLKTPGRAARHGNRLFLWRRA